MLNRLVSIDCLDQRRAFKSIDRLSTKVSEVHVWSTLIFLYESLWLGEPVDLSQEPDINVVTGLLKLYFRELKNPLMTYEYYDWFIDAASKFQNV